MAAGVDNPPAGWPRIVAHLIYEDLDHAVSWLCQAFGFEERAWARHLTDGRLSRTQLQVFDSVITLGWPSVHGQSPRQGVSSMLYVYVDDVEQHYARAQQHGATIVTPLADKPWGDRAYQVRDPEGHQWTFAQHIGDAQEH